MNELERCVREEETIASRSRGRQWESLISLWEPDLANRVKESWKRIQNIMASKGISESVDRLETRFI